MSKQDRIAATQATKTQQRVEEFTRRYEALCREFGMTLAITVAEEFVVNVPGDQRALDDRLKRQMATLTGIPYQEW